MKHRTLKPLEILALVILVVGLRLDTGSMIQSAEGSSPVSTAFTYQGQLKLGGLPVSETCDFWFSLWDAKENGNQVGPTLSFDGQGSNPLPITVVNGLFAARLDFGSSAFIGEARWLEVDVACPTGMGTIMTLSPRQPVTPTPYAAYALSGPGSGGFWAPNGDAIYSTNRGNVGIGTSEPTHPLHVKSDASKKAVYSQGTLSVHKGFGESGTGLSVSRTTTIDPLPISLKTEIDGNRIDAFGTLIGDANLILNSSSTGKVGIGTSSPQRRLQVGDNTVPDSEGMIRLASRSGTQGSNRAWDIGVPETDADTSGAGYSFVIDDTSLGAGPEFMVKYGSGNVGIGTVTPGAKLDVAGTTRTTGLEVDGGAIRVTGAGSNTSTAVFRHVPSMSNSECDAVGHACHETTIDHPLANGDPSAILFITLNGRMFVSSDSYPPQIEYDYETARWKIRLKWWDLYDLSFNVMIIKN